MHAGRGGNKLRQVRRETLDDGSIRLATEAVQVTLRRLRPGAMLVTYAGYDDGSLADVVLDELGAEAGRYRALEIFIDAENIDGVTTSVRETWTRWMQAHRDHTKITLLVASKFMHVTVNVAKHLSGFGKMITLSDRAKFDAAIRGTPKES